MSRLSGRDPLSIAPGGIGTGAAQVFDFQPFDPTEKIADAAIANAQRKQKAQAKVQEEYQNKINLFRKELDGWQDRDGEVLNKLTEDIINEGARIAAKGIDPTTLPDYRKQMEKAVLLGKKSKQDKEFYDNAFKVAMEKSKSPIYSQEDIDFDLTSLEQFATKPLLERQQFQIPLKAKEEQIDPLIGLKRFESIYAKPKKTYKDRGDGTFELVEEYDLGDIRKNFDTVKNEKWFKTLEATNPNFVDNYLDAFQTKKNIKGTADKSSVNINSGQGSWGNKQYTGRIAKYNLGKAVNEAELLGISGTDAIDIFGLRNAQPNWAQDEINVIDYSYQDNIQPKPILANTPQIVAIDDLGQKVDITAFPKGTIKYIPNRVYETKQDGVYYTTGTASINVFDAKKGINEVKNINIGFIVDDSNKFDFENQWLPDGVNIENAMQKNFDIAKEKGQTKTSATQSTTAKPTAQRKPLGSFITK